MAGLGSHFRAGMSGNVARRLLVVSVVVALAALFASSVASAAVTWTRPVTVYIGAPPGGTFDIVVRGLQPALEKALGVRVMPLNITGAAGGAAAVRLLNDPADGYQILVISRSFSAMPYIGQPHIDPVTKFTPLVTVAADVSAVSVPADSPYQTIDQLLDAARKRPSPLTLGISGLGGVWHMAGLLLQKETGTHFNFVPYQGGAEATAALAAHVLDADLHSPAEVKPYVDAGKVRILAVMADERHPLFPDVPTLKERGIDLSYVVWRGFVAKAGTPPERVQDLREKLRIAATSPEFRRAMEAAGIVVSFADAEAFGRMIREEDVLVAELLKEQGLKTSEPAR